MKKNYLFFLLFFSLKVVGQNAEINCGDTNPVNKNKWNYEIYKFYQDDNSNIYCVLKSKPTFSSKSYKIFLQKYKNPGKLLFEKELVMPLPQNSAIPEDIYFEEILFVKEKIYLFTSCYDGNTKARYLYVNSISESGIINDDSRKIDEINDVTGASVNQAQFGLAIGYLNAYHRVTDKKFEITFNSDSTLIAVYSTENFETVGKNTKYINCSVFDLDFTTRWSKKIKLDYLDYWFSFDDIKFDREGNLFFTAQIKVSDGNDLILNGNMKYILDGYFPETDQLKENIIDVGENNYATKIYFDFSPDNEIRVAGIYCLTKDMSVFHLRSYPEITTFYETIQNLPGRGYFYMVFDKNLKLDSGKKIINEFESSLVDYYHKAENNFRGMEVKGIYIGNDKIISLILERNLEEKQNLYYASPGISNIYNPSGFNNAPGFRYNSSATKKSYISHHIAVIHLDEQGAVKWTVFIPKYQRSFETKTLSFIFLSNQNRLNILYCDNTHNEKAKNVNKLRSPSSLSKKNEYILASIDSNGTLTKSVLAKSDSKKRIGTINTAAYYKISENSLLFGSGIMNRNFRLNIMKLD